MMILNHCRKRGRFRENAITWQSSRPVNEGDKQCGVRLLKTRHIACVSQLV